MHSIQDVATTFSQMLLGGQAAGAAERFWAEDIISIEPRALPDGTPAIVRGYAAAWAKLSLWSSHSAMEDMRLDGPFVTGNAFALFLDMEVVDRATGVRRPFSEIAVYLVCEGKIVEERYFYA